MDPEQIKRRVEAHVAAVGAVDIERLRSLYAEDARLYDSVGSDPVVGPDAIAAHFRRWLTAVRRITGMRILPASADNSLVAVAFTATPGGGDPVDIIDVMRFGPDLLIGEMTAFATRKQH